MVEVTTAATNSFLTGLACLSLDSELRSALVFDASPSSIQLAAKQLAIMVEIATNQVAEVVTIGATETEDSLWGAVAIRQGSQGNWIGWENSRLAQSPVNPSPRIIVIPDLARLGLSAARAGVMLIGSSIATLQRQGQNVVWEPNLWWLAGCARAEVGEVSPHLLDRFALRLSVSNVPAIDRASDICNWVMQTSTKQSDLQELIPNSLHQQLLEAADSFSKIPSNLLSYFTSYIGNASLGMRREIALARLSRSLARLEGVSEISRKHIDQAAEIVGLQAPLNQNFEPSTPSHDSQQENSKPQQEEIQSQEAVGDSSDDIEGFFVEEPVIQPNEELVFAETSVSATPYPEDGATVARSADSLQLPPQRTQSVRSTEGSIIGTQRAARLHDIALVSTVLEAAKFQKIRSINQNHATRFQISRTDLRSYRRAPTPQQMLVVLLDYTCLQGCAWEDAILPHLSWAYITRASVSVIQVGSSRAKNYLRAEQVTERSLLSPRIGAAFEEQAGIATPLAHGLDLAIRTVRAALQHGRGRVQQARFVVISDGRGNVPLEASRAGELKSPVSREGIEDALEVAKGLPALKQVETFVLNPQPKQYADLPVMLAEILGVIPEPISILAPEESRV